MQKTILITKLPPATPACTVAWCTGFPIHKGKTEGSLNVATLWAAEQKIIPQADIIEREWEGLKCTLEAAGCNVHVVDFPQELNTDESRDHDAIFIRDSGIMFGEYWIKAHFSVEERKKEADYYAQYIQNTFNKKMIELSGDAFVEGGDLWFVETAHGSFYFGGQSRSNKKGHEEINNIINADHFFVIDSNGYHIDTVLTPVLNAENKLVALLIGKNTVSEKSLADLHTLGVEMLFVDKIDCIGTKEKPGTLAINGLSLPGKLINAYQFQTAGIEERLHELGIERFVTPLSQFAYAGGSVHCLTNEVR